jgi:dipeptidyl aminopeptidase/acylaminoacyl peptidase
MLSLVLATALSISDYSTMPVPSSPRLSHDGRRVVFTVTRADMERSAYDSDLWMAAADGSSVVQLTRTKADDSDPAWSPDGKRIAFVSDRDAGRNAIWLIDPNGGEPWQLTHEKGTISRFEWSPDSRAIAFVMGEPTAEDPDEQKKQRDDVHVVGAPSRQRHLYVIDIDSACVRRLTRGAFSIDHPSWSPDGKRIVFERMPANAAGDWYMSDLYTVFTDVECNSNSNPIMTPVVVRPGTDAYGRFSPDGRWIAFFSQGGGFDWLRETDLYIVPASGGRPQLASRDYNRSANDIFWTGDSRSIYLAGPWNTTSQLFRVHADGTGFTSVTNVEGLVADVDVSNSARKFVFVQQNLTTPPEVYVSDLGAFAPRQLTHLNDAFRDRTLGATRVIRWKNPQDGLEIEGLLTLPAGYEAGKRYPLLTFVHGGPASRFDQGFLGYLGHLYTPHVLAANGFAVLRPNPRGTGGYGQQFREANRNDWGGMDWVDINAGIDKLIADGIADPSRMGLMGWSYGGFMASWALGHSDRLRAISVGAPVVDLVSFHGTTDIRDFIPSYFRGTEVPKSEQATEPNTDAPALQAMAHAPLSLELLRAHSPLWQLKPTKAAVLIQHGEDDERVPPSQGMMLYRMLEDRGVNVAMVTYPRAHHVPREPRQRVDIATRNLEFFRQYVLNAGSPAPPSSSSRSR